MIDIELNGKKVASEADNLADFLVEAGFGGAVVATALNGDFIAQSARGKTQLSMGDKVEVLAPMQGG